MDANQDGRVSLEELCNHMAAAEQTAGDANGDGNADVEGARVDRRAERRAQS